MSRNPWRAIRAVERLRGIRPFGDYPVRDTGLSSAAGGPLYERPEDVIAEEPRVWEAWASLINAWHQRLASSAADVRDSGTPDLTVGRTFACVVAL